MSVSAPQIIAWREAIRALRESFEYGSRCERLWLLGAAFAAFAALDRECEVERDAFSFPLLRDGRVDGETIHKVCLYGASVGELILSSQPLPDALESGWTLLPAPPITITTSETMQVGTKPDTTSQVTWMQSVVDPAAEEHARADATQFFIEQMRDAVKTGAEAWLEKLEACGPAVLCGTGEPADLPVAVDRGSDGVDPV